MTDLWNQFNQVMQTYEENNGQKKRSFEELREKDEKSAREIDLQMRKINKLLVRICINNSALMDCIFKYFSRRKSNNTNIK